MQSYDVCVVGATPAGIAAAIRAAREGHTVLLTQHTRHIGGMCTNGLGQWDSKSDHRRCPIFGEILDRLEAHYREHSGADSADHHAARYSIGQFPPGAYEPSVIEGIFNDMVAAERGMTLWRGVYPEAARTTGGHLASVSLRDWEGEGRHDVAARIFVDATYEGDLAAAAQVPYRVGREARDEYGEPHAGMLFNSCVHDREEPRIARDGYLNVMLRRQDMGEVDPASPFSADARVQAYNLRPCVCKDPTRRLYPDRPAHYDPEALRHFRRRTLSIQADINGKNSYNAPILPGENWDYPEGDWPTRQRLYERHRDFAVALMYFLQNDPSVPAEERERFRTWGLPSDEYTDNDHLPYEMYVRETRRIVGAYVLTETDLSPREGFWRPQPFPDSVAFTDWYMDSHSCSRDVGTWGTGDDLLGSARYPFDGKLMLMAAFRPGMIPYRCLVPQGVDNLLVPVCASASHVAWGAVRLEPCWIHLGEVAGFAAAQALARGQTVPNLDVGCLQQTLLGSGADIAFFNEHRRAAEHPSYGDRQLAACHGEWDRYDLDPI